jgi:ATP-dependent DNA helicase RecQ
MDNVPKCPVCGKPMIERMARRGANAGNHFWGCSDYPHCRGTLDITSESIEGDQPSLNSIRRVTDIRFSARARRSSDDVRFHQGIAGPYRVLEEINQSDEMRTNYLFNGHWRMDFPYHATQNDPKLHFLANQIQKLYKRGKITLLSPSLEDEIYRIFSDIHPIVSQPLSSVIEFVDPPKRIDIELDGEGSEHIFYWDILPSVLGDHFYQYVTPQVLHQSFAQTTSGEGETRLDFLIALSDRCIAIEIDDESHSQHVERDQIRDSILSDFGIKTYRIPVDEIMRRSGPILYEVLGVISKEKVTSSPLSVPNVCAWAIKCAYQIQFALVEAFDRGLFQKPGTVISVNLNSSCIDSKHTSQFLRAICNDFIDQITMLQRLYGLEFFDLFDYIELVDSVTTSGDVTITYQTDQKIDGPTITVQDIYLPFQITDPCSAIKPFPVADAGVDVLSFFLRFLFRKESFLEGQYETLERILHNRDTIVLLPTGAGKSIAFQLAAFLLPGVSVAVDPIIALIYDQIDNLARIGIDRVNGITSDIRNRDDKNTIKSLFGVGEYLLFYVSLKDFR